MFEKVIRDNLSPEGVAAVIAFLRTASVNAPTTEAQRRALAEVEWLADTLLDLIALVRDRAGQNMMDLARLDQHVLAVNRDGVVFAVANLAIAESNLIGGDFDQCTVSPLAKPPEQKEAVYANRRRTRGERGKRLQRLRSELAERS